MRIGVKEETIRAMLPANDGFGYDAHYYIWGKVYKREYDGGYRETAKHCTQDCTIWGPNDIRGKTQRWKGRCTKCNTHWKADSLEELWDKIASQE